MLGRTIGNYVVQRKIGEGGMGAVYSAVHPRIGRHVAVKVLHPHLGTNPEIVNRFFTEARAANEIHNEHIIEILDFGELPDGTPYFIMEWLDGQSLAEALERHRKFALERALHIARGVGRALAAAHVAGIVHRDLKPDNIFLVTRGDDPDFVKVLDFGIAKLMQSDPNQQYKTQTGAIMGTPYYMSPEQCRGSTREMDHRADIYSFGVIVYQMMTGRLPFLAEGLGELLLAHMTRPPTPPIDIDPSIPQAISDAILRALAKDAAQRFGSIREMMGALGDGGSRSGKLPLAPQSSSNLATSLATTLNPAASVPPARLHMTTLGGAAAEAVETTAVKRNASRFLVAGAFAAAAAVTTGYLVLRKPAVRGQDETKAATAVTNVTSRPSPPPPPAVEALPKTVRLNITTEPPGAKITLDDRPIQSLPLEVPRATEEHKIEVTAPGHIKDTRTLTFDKDIDLKVTLARLTRPRPLRTRTQNSDPKQSPESNYKLTRPQLIKEYDQPK